MAANYSWKGRPAKRGEGRPDREGRNDQLTLVFMILPLVATVSRPCIKVAAYEKVKSAFEDRKLFKSADMEKMEKLVIKLSIGLTVDWPCCPLLLLSIALAVTGLCCWLCIAVRMMPYR
jgi:hypothetical protein